MIIGSVNYFVYCMINPVYFKNSRDTYIAINFGKIEFIGTEL